MEDDPRCPACDGPVGVSATYCMHCGATFERPADGERGSVDASDTDRTAGGAAANAERSPADRGTVRERLRGIETLETRTFDEREGIDWWVMLQVGVGSGLVLGVFAIPVARLVLPVWGSVVVGSVVGLLTTGLLLSRDSLAAVRRAVAATLAVVVGSYVLGTVVVGPGGATVETVGVYVVGGVVLLSLSYRPEWWLATYS